MKLLVFMWSLQACTSCYKSTACTRWFKYDQDKCGLFTHKSVPVIFEPPCIYVTLNLLQILILANSHMLQLTMRNSFHVVETEAVAELGRGHPHQNLARRSVAMLPVLSLLKEHTKRHYS